MMAIQKLKPAKPVAYEPVMLAVSKARAMASVLEQLGDTNKALSTPGGRQPPRGDA